MKTLLVTGGCGFIGSHSVRLIFREHPACSVINVDLLTYAGNLEIIMPDGMKNDWQKIE